jgi:glyoxylase-like metal-dependent hydrolase (beta-lactamase superfamily II)
LLVLAVSLGACGGGPPAAPRGGGSGGGEGGAGGGGGAGGPAGLEPGTLQVRWMHGSANCAQDADPEVQVHAYNATTYILRQNKCDTFEAPFVYVLVGATSALVLDSGGTTTPALRERVRGIVGARPLLVAHSHHHGDHVAGDAQFTGQPLTTVVARTRAAVQAAFGIAAWPTDVGSLDLGGRVLDVLAIPGHQAEHIAIYDRRTGLLLTGDSLYPGFLFVRDWATYRASISRLAAFVAAHPVAHVLGAHVEMTATPKVSYPYRTTYQPNEHVLQLSATHVMELDAALTALGPTPPAAPVAYDHFVIDPS